ncbi:MAG: Hsp20/alpha crystallin family protein, partial [Thermoanaerobaculia bacterium]|nr:Hsp20/alpha crystallin family protein [Thermoanaerobaculia bacterium]
DITVEDGVLTLSGERRMEEQTEEKGYRRVERRYGSFSRSLTLPRDIDADNVSASFKDGLLTVQVPKKETAKPRSIKIN